MNDTFYKKANKIKLSVDGKCGPLNNNTMCPVNKYCSSYGDCNNEGHIDLLANGDFKGDWLGKYDGNNIKKDEHFTQYNLIKNIYLFIIVSIIFYVISLCVNKK